MLRSLINKVLDWQELKQRLEIELSSIYTKGNRTGKDLPESARCIFCGAMNSIFESGTSQYNDDVELTGTPLCILCGFVMAIVWT